MVKKKKRVARKSSSSKVSKRSSLRSSRPVLKSAPRTRSRRSLFVALKNFFLFVVLALLSFLFYNMSTNSLYVNLFWILSIIFLFMSLAFLIAILALLILRLFRR